MRNKYLSGIIAFLLLFSSVSLGLAEAHTAPPVIESVTMERDGNLLSYPQLTGLADAEIQRMINDDIFLSANLSAHMITFATLTPDSLWGLQVTYEAYVTDRVASFVISADGKMPNSRQGQTCTALTYDLTTGKRINAEALFEDFPEAIAWLEEEALSTLGEEISDYEDSSALLPLPVEQFSLDRSGITFWYAPEQFKTVNGRVGACQFTYDEIRHLLKNDPQGIPAALGLLETYANAQEQKDAIDQAMTDGKLEQWPVALGDAMPLVVDTYGLTRTPDEFPGGRYFVLEHPLFRSVLLISDAMEAGWEHSVVEGIQLRRGGVGGLLIGQACKQDVQTVLGNPDETIQMTENMAYDYHLTTGECFLYHHQSATLRFYFDDAECLTAIQLESN